ncbi:MAG: hypothetical protein HC810_02770, partial [Acaryochloridaceae cyanobacterium RL_2_7]|nr:hypothetical protein [Acaryochloridaceae cyanobacterium RL_2_7]
AVQVYPFKTGILIDLEASSIAPEEPIVVSPDATEAIQTKVMPGPNNPEPLNETVLKLLSDWPELLSNFTDKK